MRFSHALVRTARSSIASVLALRPRANLYAGNARGGGAEAAAFDIFLEIVREKLIPRLSSARRKHIRHPIPGAQDNVDIASAHAGCHAARLTGGVLHGRGTLSSTSSSRFAPRWRRWSDAHSDGPEWPNSIS